MRGVLVRPTVLVRRPRRGVLVQSLPLVHLGVRGRAGGGADAVAGVAVGRQRVIVLPSIVVVVDEPTPGRRGSSAREEVVGVPTAGLDDGRIVRHIVHAHGSATPGRLRHLTTSLGSPLGRVHAGGVLAVGRGRMLKPPAVVKHPLRMSGGPEGRRTTLVEGWRTVRGLERGRAAALRRASGTRAPVYDQGTAAR